MVAKFNVVKGFLNLVIADSFYLNFFNSIKDDAAFSCIKNPIARKLLWLNIPHQITVTFAFRHIRNNLGYSVAEILKAAGHKVYKTQIINDRGIHICKSMLAWQKFGNGETPESSGLKSDHLVGKYYVAFDKAYKAEIASLVENGTDKKDAEKQASILLEAQEMLRKWEAGDEEVVALWKNDEWLGICWF